MVIKQNLTLYHITAIESPIVFTTSLRPSMQYATLILRFSRPHALVSYSYSHAELDESKGKEKNFRAFNKKQQNILLIFS